MRRSAAPSQLGLSAKRPRFVPPVRKQPLAQENQCPQTTTDQGSGGGIGLPGGSLPQQASHSCTSLGLEHHGSRIHGQEIQAENAEKSKERSAMDIINLINSTAEPKSPSSSSKNRSLMTISSGKPPDNIFADTSAVNMVNGQILNGNLETNQDRLSNSVSTNLKETCLRNNLSDKTCLSSWNPPASSTSNSDDITTSSTTANDCITAARIGSTNKRKPFRAPALMKKTPLQKNNSENKPKEDVETPNRGREQSDGPKPHYYSVMWCKLSKKKHKKWEGDAILIAKGRTVTLVDMDGKDIGRGSGYKTSELQTLEEGHSLVIGGKEIEVMGLLSEEDFTSGRCFQGAYKPSSPPLKPQAKQGLIRAFVKPGKTGGSTVPQANDAAATNFVPQPKFNPAAPGALVMPRPSQAHQWECNHSKLPVIDVVVDPHISTHLRPHQRDGICFLYQCIMGMKNYSGQGAILADEMGLGKTVQTIALVWTLLKQGPYGGKPVIKRTLIITPGSLVKNWCREFRKWLGSERVNVFAVGPDKKVEDYVLAPVQPVVIISYEMFVRSIDTIKKVNFDLLVCDEGHRLKNTNIKTTTLVGSLPTRRRIILTGTPVQNDLQELYSIVEFCNPGILGSSSAFHHVYEGPILASRQPQAGPAETTLGETRAAELNRITSMFILRRTQDINNKYLPPKVEVVLFCQPSDLQLQLYHQLVSSRAVRSCLTSGTDMAQHLMCIAALRKLCNHPSLIHSSALKSQTVHHSDSDVEVQLYQGLKELYPAEYDPSDLQRDHSGKLTILAQLLHHMHGASPMQRVVLVSNYTQTLDVLELLCRSEGYSFLRLDGQTPTAKRQQLVERFNNKYSKDFVFLLSSKAGGVGLNLIGASWLILYDIDWNPANDLQAMARVWRDGQKQKVFIYRLLTTGTIEEKMYQRQISKQGLSGVVVDAKTDNKLHFSPEELRDLFVLQENTVCGTHDLMDCQCSGNHGNTNHVTPDSQHRTCQLQPQAARNKQKNVCMDELMEWQHIRGPGADLSTVDPILESDGLQQVTFTFWNETNQMT